MLRTKFKNENEQKAITPKVWNFELWFLCTALFLNEINLPMKFHVNALHNFKVMLQTKFTNENEQRTIAPKVCNVELWFLCIALLLNAICMPMKFQVSSLNTFWVMLRTKFKYENKQRAITPKVWNAELWFLCTALLLNKIYLPMKFLVVAFHNFQVMLRTKFKYENKQRAITPKVWNVELWFLCTTLLLNKIYLPMKFLVYALHNFKVMLRTKFKYEKELRTITLKVWNFELWFLCTALLLNENYLWSFMLMPFIVLKLCPGQKGTDGRTDGQTSQSLYATLRGHKKSLQL